MERDQRDMRGGENSRRRIVKEEFFLEQEYCFKTMTLTAAQRKIEGEGSEVTPYFQTPHKTGPPPRKE